MSGIMMRRRNGRHYVLPGLYTSETFDPATLGSNVSLSGGNLTALLSTGGTTSGARGTLAVTGKQYFEVVLSNPGGPGGNAANGFAAFGIAQLTSTYVNLGNTVPNGALAFRSGVYVNSGSSVGSFTGAAYVPAGSAVAIDYPNKRIWFRSGTTGDWNNSSSNNPSTNVGGYDFTAISGAALYPVVLLRDASDQCVINFGATPFVGTKPSGYN